MATAIDASKETHADVAAAEVLRRFVGYYKPYKALFFADLVAACILAGVDLAFPQLLNFFTREFFTESPSVILGSLGLIALLFIALYAARTGCQWFITYWGHVMGARMEADMRRDLFEQYQRLSFGYYDRHNTAVMMSKITTDLFDISELAHHGPENLFICTLKIVGSFVLLFMINVPLTAIMLAATAVMAAYAFWRNYRKRVIFTENRRKMADINARLQDSLGGIRVVKSFGNEGVEIAKFGGTNERFVDTKESSYRFMGAFHAVNSVFTGVLYTVTIVGGGYFVATGGLAPAELAIYALYIGIFLSVFEITLMILALPAELFIPWYSSFYMQMLPVFIYTGFVFRKLFGLKKKGAVLRTLLANGLQYVYAFFAALGLLTLSLGIYYLVAPEKFKEELNIRNRDARTEQVEGSQQGEGALNDILNGFLDGLLHEDEADKSSGKDGEDTAGTRDEPQKNVPENRPETEKTAAAGDNPPAGNTAGRQGGGKTLPGK